VKRLTWLTGPPGAGKTTFAQRLLQCPCPLRVVELAHLLHSLVDPSRPRRGMMRAKGLFIQAIRQVELDPANGGLAPLVVIVALIEEDLLLPLGPDEDLILLLPERTQWERQLLERPERSDPGSRPMSLREAREWYERYRSWRSPRHPA
jgi:hypothetical protein